MGNIWIRELTGGLDTRRLPETSTGGVLVVANNGHITSGGEFEQRAAFVPFASVPGTIGLAYSPDSIVVFGSAPGVAVPAGVVYQQLEHPDGETLVAIRSFDLYAGKLYVAAEFADGEILHFYDGELVEFWFDGRARASFEMTSGNGNTGAAGATGSVTFTLVASPTGQLTQITINAINLLTAPVPYTVEDPFLGPTGYDFEVFANAVANAINANSGTSGFSASVNSLSTGRVNIRRIATGPAINGMPITVTYPPGDMTVVKTVMSGGSDGVQPSISSVKIGGIEALSAPVVWAGSREATMAALATAIDTNSGATGFHAEVTEATVRLVAIDAGVAANGKEVDIVASSSFVFTPLDIVTEGGEAATQPPGSFVKTFGQKMYSTSGPNLHFSAIKDPTQWSVGEGVGAGFIDMSTESSGSEELRAVARYQQLIAIFSERNIQTWYVDPDPSLNRQSQTLNNTGTAASKSVTQFGDNDLFYLDESGIRSLKARDSSNAASTTDIGVPVDTLVREYMATLTQAQREAAIGLIEPTGGRFWLIIASKIFVFSFFNGAKVSAWSTYDTTIMSSGEPTAIDVSAAVPFKRRVYLRAGDTIYTYGGATGDPVYDATPAEAWTPYFDANAPTKAKQFSSIDVYARGMWKVRASLEPNRIEAEEDIARAWNTTHNSGQIPYTARGRFIMLRFVSEGVRQGGGPHKLSAANILFTGGGSED